MKRRPATQATPGQRVGPGTRSTAGLEPSPLLGLLDEVPPGAPDEASSAEGPPGGKSPTRPLWHPDEGEVADPGCQVADEGSPSKTMPSG